MTGLTGNTKAILLLTAPLVTRRNGEGADLLKPAEYRKLALRLREVGAQPADLLATTAGPLLAECRRAVEEARLRRLLGRGFLLSQAFERWQARAIWVVSRADSAYPQRVKSRLKDDSPPVLYGCGEHPILDSGGLAVVGSRNAGDSVLDFARETGSVTARAGRTLISGGARGVDQAAMRGALESGGRAAGILADSLEKTAMNREQRNLVLDGRLVLVSPYDPGAGFNVGHAMQRNKLIYALADAALVVSAEYEKGGTWAGATEQLERLRFVPMYVPSSAGSSGALASLLKKGARTWPNPRTAADLDVVLAGRLTPEPSKPSQPELPLRGQDATDSTDRVRETFGAETTSPSSEGLSSARAESDAADELLAAVRALVVRVLAKPLTSADVATKLRVSKSQVDAWLKLLVVEGLIERRSKPVTYAVKQADLFKGSPARR